MPRRLGNVQKAVIAQLDAELERREQLVTEALRLFEAAPGECMHVTTARRHMAMYSAVTYARHELHAALAQIGGEYGRLYDQGVHGPRPAVYWHVKAKHPSVYELLKLRRSWVAKSRKPRRKRGHAKE